MSKKLLIIDSFGLIFRAYHAYPILTKADGSPTNAIFGVLQMLLGSIEKFDPDYILCSLESETPTFRHKLAADYKGKRKEVDNELQVQIPQIINMIQSLNIKTLQKDGYEADDVIGSYATQMQDQFDRVDIITGDRDLLQLISDKIHIFMPGKSFSDLIEYDREKFTEKFGIALEDFVTYKTLIGDASDNIKGVPGIGPKTAATMVNQFHTIQSILANTDQLSQRFAIAIEENKDLLERYYELCKIETGIECDLKPEDIKVSKINASRLRTIIREMEFTSMTKRIAKFIDNFEKKHGGFGLFAEFDDDNKNHEVEYSLGEKFTAASATVGAGLDPALPLDTNSAYLIEVKDGYRFGDGKSFVEIAENELYNFVILNKIKTIIGFNMKPFIKKLLAAGIEKIDEFVFLDLKLMWFLIRSNLVFENLNEIASHLNSSSYEELLKKTLEEIKKNEMQELFELERQTQIVLANMEFTGVDCDKEYLMKLEEEFKDKIQEIKKRIFDHIGFEFNPASTKELGHVLFEVLKLPVFKKNKTGFSTDDGTLTKLMGMNDIIPMIKEFRLYSKVLSTYILGLQNSFSEDGKIHTTYVQDQVATGRLSSINPNLQNLPNDEKFGPMIRKAFKAKEGEYLSLDYSQIDLRVLAYETQDKELLRTFKNDEDIHTSTGKAIFEKDELTKQERNFAKTVNFGIVYGMEPYGLSQSLGITQAEAKDFIDKYLEKFVGVKVYFDKITKTLDEKGYVQTFLGRRRYFDAWKATKGFQKKMLFREAINMPIQGGTSEIMKLAMVKIAEVIKEEKCDCNLVLQIHDEVILHVKNPKDTEKITKKILDAMNNAYDLGIPLKASAKVGKDLAFKE